jgi:lysophospholipase L1-like esterase
VSSRQRVRLFALLLCVISTALALVAAEILLRMMPGPQPPAPLPAEVSAGLPQLRTMFELARRDQRGIFKNQLFETNSAGFRDREFPETKPPDVFRIAVIGDSFTMGSGVRAEDTYSKVLERNLNGPSVANRYEVLNLGLAGLNLVWSVDNRLREIGLRFDPDMIVYGFTINDLEGSDYVAFERTRRRPGASALWNLVLNRWDYCRELIAPPPTSYVRELHHNFFENPQAWGTFEAALDRLATIARERNACVVVLLHTQLQVLNSWHPFIPIYDRVAEAAEARGMSVARSLPDHLGENARSLHITPTDSHPNARGHEILATTLRNHLAKLPPTCWHGTAPPLP